MSNLRSVTTDLSLKNVSLARCPISRKEKLTGKADLRGAIASTVSAEQMEISRLRDELARVKMERDILGKATAYFAKASS